MNCQLLLGGNNFKKMCPEDETGKKEKAKAGCQEELGLFLCSLGKKSRSWAKRHLTRNGTPQGERGQRGLTEEEAARASAGCGFLMCFQPEMIPEAPRMHSSGRGWEIALSYRKSTIIYKVYSMLLHIKGLNDGIDCWCPTQCCPVANNTEIEWVW